MTLLNSFPCKGRTYKTYGVRSSSIYPNLRILIENPWQVKPPRKTDLSKSQFDKSFGNLAIKLFKDGKQPQWVK
jgi:hypothetical protein